MAIHLLIVMNYNHSVHLIDLLIHRLLSVAAIAFLERPLNALSWIQLTWPVSRVEKMADGHSDFAW